jgi:hypothetical protein
VTDNLTGLIWLEEATCGGKGLNWSDAIDYADELDDGECDLSDGSAEGDWRLPNVRELLSLTDYGNYDPALCNTMGVGQHADGDPFLNVQTDFDYWTTTTRAEATGRAWCVDMYDGTKVSGAGYEKWRVNKYVWPVRGGQ